MESRKQRSELKKVLILCTGNSCRSLMAEALVNHLLGDRYLACSAGVAPSAPNPVALQTLEELGIATAGLRSKSVSEFLNRDDLDLVITVCDHAKESCPVFAKPVPTLHLGIEDPAPYTNAPDALKIFRRTREQILAKVIARLRDICPTPPPKRK
ncbi:MAG: arsenate reductase ArsC [Candidatus Cloacimonetes bacterium]|nr:arsenate reductase ArsC [Candidatus Cloacimonadota bacterium]